MISPDLDSIIDLYTGGGRQLDQLVLKEDDIFVVSDALGEIPEGDTAFGCYYRDSRHLSVFELTVNGTKPDLLSSSGEHNFMGNVQMANPLWELDDGLVVLPHTVSIRRNRLVKEGLHERVGLYSYNSFPVPVELKVTLGADFRDILDIRGFASSIGGRQLSPVASDSTVLLAYLGRDDVRRETEITFDCLPSTVELEEMVTSRTPREVPAVTLPDGSVGAMRAATEVPCVRVSFRILLRPQVPFALNLQVVPRQSDANTNALPFEAGVRQMREHYDTWLAGCASLTTDNELFNATVSRSASDLRALIQQWPIGAVPDAGIPWFVCPFGRDSLISALQSLVLNPEIAVGTLRFLASTQGRELDEWRDEEPGKIVHELRRGELANLREVPHTAYYGSVDATPLFLLLFAETMSWLDDDDLYRELLPSALLALEWIDAWGDLDGDGYVEYKTRSPQGLRNQGWKDSVGGICYRSGLPVEPPIALAEVQGYVYAAKTRLADLLARKGQGDLATNLRAQAARLREAFNRDFWIADEGFFALALDPDKKPVDTVTSNPGHGLFCGIVDEDRAEKVVSRLLSDDIASGWGLRTMSDKMPCFNPMSYHNGSVWPHDNSLIVAGMRRYGFDREANEIISQLYQASLCFRYNRLPELFCGFARDLRYYSVPAEYPVRCSPQAWAAGSSILIFQTMLGIHSDATNRRLILKPSLPEWVNNARVEGLRVGQHRIDLHVGRFGDHYSLGVTRNAGRVTVQLG